MDDSTTSTPANEASPRSPWPTRVLAMALVIAAAIGLASLTSNGPRDDELETLFPVPAFELTDQDGHAFGTSQLQGRVWVASFLFTSCSQACPTLSGQLANLRRRTAHHGDRFEVISITVDPETDTPARLREYRDRFGDPGQWTLLTGAPDDVNATMERAFFQPAATRTEISAAPGFDILHGTGVILVDRDGRARALFPTDGEGLDRLVAAIDRLLE